MYPVCNHGCQPPPNYSVLSFPPFSEVYHSLSVCLKMWWWEALNQWHWGDYKNAHTWAPPQIYIELRGSGILYDNKRPRWLWCTLKSETLRDRKNKRQRLLTTVLPNANVRMNLLNEGSDCAGLGGVWVTAGLTCFQWCWCYCSPDYTLNLFAQ